LLSLLCRGWIRCRTCDGYRNLIHYLQLDIQWRNRQQRGVIDAEDNELSATERTRLAGSDAVRDAHGPLIYSEEDVVLALRDAVNGRVNPGVNTTVNRMLETAQDPTQLQHRQRLGVRGLPVYRVSYLEAGKPCKLWIMGTNRTVEAPDMPKDMKRLSLAIVLGLLLLLAVLGGIGALVYFVFL
jgi:hypothetical protein